LSKVYDRGSSLSAKILEGVNILADNVVSTLGPKGRNVILQEKGKRPIITKDGVTVAEFVHLDDPFQNAAAQIIKQAARETNAVAGDGTTTATVLARAILIECQKYVMAGSSPIELKRGIDACVEKLTENLQEMSRPIQSEEDISHIATISANNDPEIGKLISQAVDSVGKDGSIIIENGRAVTTSIELIEGFRFDSGYAAAAFITDQKRGAVVYEDPLILIADCKVDKVSDILHILETVAREQRALIIIASEIEGEALAALIMNTVRGTMKIAAVKAPRYGMERKNILNDLCKSTGASFVATSGELKLKDVKLEHMGTSSKVEILKGGTTIIGGAGDYDEIEKQIEILKVEIDNTEDLNECERIQERITRLASGVALIRVGAPTEVELIEKKHRIEDALEAVKAAREEGVVPGGGVALIRASKGVSITLTNEDQRIGAMCVLDAVRQPLRQMAINGGESPDIIEHIVMSQPDHFGYDFRNQREADLYEEGIIDPVKVTKCALRNAASAAGTLLTTNYAIVEKE